MSLVEQIHRLAEYFEDVPERNPLSSEDQIQFVSFRSTCLVITLFCLSAFPSTPSLPLHLRPVHRTWKQPPTAASPTPLTAAGGGGGTGSVHGPFLTAPPVFDLRLLPSCEVTDISCMNPVFTPTHE